MLNFLKNFIYYTMSVLGLISLSLTPTKLHSQQQTHNPWLNLRESVALLSPHDNQKLFVTAFNWPLFLKQTAGIFLMQKDLVDMSNEEKATFIHILLQNYKLVLQPLEAERLQSIAVILQSTESEIQPMSSLLWAIVKKDDGFLRQLSLQQQQNLIFNKVVALQLPVSPEPIIWDFLTEAILANNLTVVRMILESDIRKQNKAEKYRLYSILDPLSLSLMNYASLPKNHASKKVAQQIVRLVAKHTPDVNDTSTMAWQVPPIIWALTLGLTDEVEYLISNHQAQPVSTLVFANTNMHIEIDLLEYLQLRKFNTLEQYIKKLGLDDWENCKKVFH